MPLIQQKINKRATLFTDGFKSYDRLVNIGYQRHYRVHHGKNEFGKKEKNIRKHINGIENFWGLAKVRFSKFGGMNKKHLQLIKNNP